MWAVINIYGGEVASGSESAMKEEAESLNYGLDEPEFKVVRLY